jgi:hypothetical protein
LFAEAIFLALLFPFGHVLLHGHACNGLTDHVEREVRQVLEADTTFTHVELLAALLVFTGEPG